MTKRVMVQMPVSVGIKTVFDEREDIECEVFTELSEENILQHIGNYDAAILGIAPFTARIVGAASRLKIVSRFGVGYDAVDVDALTRAGIPLAVVGSANSVTVAEHALMFMLALAKHTVAYDRMVRKGAWEIRFDHPPVDLAGRTVLILGFGRIGRRLVKRCLGMEMTVLVHDPYVIQDAIATAGAAGWRLARGVARCGFSVGQLSQERRNQRNGRISRTGSDEGNCLRSQHRARRHRRRGSVGRGAQG